MAATATGLLRRAQLTLEALHRTSSPVTDQQWASFDQTVYRLLHELVRARTGWLPADPQALALYRAYRDYPSPLQPADDRADLSLKETARLLGTTDTVIRRRILNGAMLAASTDAGYRIPRSELALGQEPRPASSTDSHPLSRLACELGALTDLLVTNRTEPSLPELKADSAAWIGRETLALAEGAARRTLALCEPKMGDRPLSIAQYAATAKKVFTASVAPRGVQDPTIAPSDADASVGAGELSSSIHKWARAAQQELRAQVPSVEVLRDINRQGIHMYAAVDSILRCAASQHGALAPVHDRLRESARSLQDGAEAWTQTTTGMPPSAHYVDAARHLYATLAQTTTGSGTPRDPEVAYQALLRGAHEVAWLMTLVTPQAPRLLESKVLFIHARHGRRDTRRLQAVTNGRMTVAADGDVPNLATHAWAAERSASSTARALPGSIDPWRRALANLTAEL